MDKSKKLENRKALCMERAVLPVAGFRVHAPYLVSRLVSFLCMYMFSQKGSLVNALLWK